MQPDKQKLLQLFDQAKATETEGIKIYEEAAAKASDAKAKEIFQMLAKAEARHHKLIEETKEYVDNSYATHDWKGGFIPEMGKEIEAIGRQYIPKVSEETLAASALDAINAGIKVEKASIAFYTDAKSKVSEVAAHNLYNVLLISENVHLLLLEMHQTAITSGAKRA